VRTYTISAATKISVDGGDNGGVAFIGENRRDVKIVARVQTSADDNATATEIARQIRVFTDGGRIRSEGLRIEITRHVSELRRLRPSQANLDAITENGGISAEDVRGEMTFEATNGGIHLSDIGGERASADD